MQNVETLAHLALIARHGAGWFRRVGPWAEPGTLLVTVSGAVDRPGVVEVQLGAPLPDVLEHGALRHPAPVLVGGFHGAWLAARGGEPAALSRASLRQFGASPGAGVLIALPARTSGHGRDRPDRRLPRRAGRAAVRPVPQRVAGDGGGAAPRRRG